MDERRHSVETETVKPVEFLIVGDPEMRQLLRDRVQGLVDKVRKEKTDAVVFLDKSARPISWLFREIWKWEHSKDARPEIRFINVGRSLESHLDRDIPFLVFTSPVKETRALFGDQFDHKNVMIVDEISISGNTLMKALSLFRLSFPTARMDSMSIAKATDTRLWDENCFPWMLIPGATGVLELSEEVTSSSLLERSVREVHDKLVRRVAEELFAEDLEAIRNEKADDVERMTSEFSALAGAWDELKRLGAVPPVMAGEFESVHGRFARMMGERDKTKKGYVLDQYLCVAAVNELMGDVSRFVDTEEFDFNVKSLDTLEVTRKMRFQVVQLARSLDLSSMEYFHTRSHGTSGEAMVLAKEAAAYADPKQLAVLASQLRAEMKEIAKLPVSPERS